MYKLNNIENNTQSLSKDVAALTGKVDSQKIRMGILLHWHTSLSAVFQLNPQPDLEAQFSSGDILCITSTGSKWLSRMINYLLLTARYFIHWQRLFHGRGRSIPALLDPGAERLLTKRNVCRAEGRTAKFSQLQRHPPPPPRAILGAVLRQSLVNL